MYRREEKSSSIHMVPCITSCRPLPTRHAMPCLLQLQTLDPGRNSTKLSTFGPTSSEVCVVGQQRSRQAANPLSRLSASSNTSSSLIWNRTTNQSGLTAASSSWSATMTIMVTREGAPRPGFPLDQRFRTRLNVPFPFRSLQSVTVYTEYPAGQAVYTCDDTGA